MKSKKILLVFTILLTGITSCKKAAKVSSLSSNEESVISATSEISENSSNETKSEGVSSAVQSSLAVSSTVSIIDSSNDYYQSGDYYSSVSDSMTGKTLISQLNSIITTGYKSIGYGGLWSAYATTDVYPGTNKVWDIYSSCEFNVSTGHSGNYSKEGDMYNREHTTPQSWWGGGTGVAQGNDIFNVYPTDGKVNGVRSNYPYGEVANATYTSSNGCKLGSSSRSDYSGTVFEVADEYKGDIARTYFYMVTRYNQESECFNQGEGSRVYKNSFPYLTNYALNLFLEWSENDPVSQKEIDRNNAAYKLQGNRNPYIDHASYIQKIFGGNGTGTVGGVNATTSIEKSYEVVTTPVTGKAYKLGMTQESLGADYFFDGSMTSTGYYMSTTGTYASGVDVYLEETTGGYYIYFTKNGTKNYINMTSSTNSSKTYYNPSIGTTASSVWTYNTEKNTFVTEISGTDCYLGTYSSYTTISGSSTSYFTSSTSYQSHLYESK